MTQHVPDDMRASVLLAPHKLTIQLRPTPAPGTGEVLIKVTAVGVCGSDVHYYEHGRIGDFVVRQPLILGHEVAGEIVAVGAGVPSGRIGERVAVEPGKACGHCQQCTNGRYNLCPDMQFFATPPVDGALCEYVCMPSILAFAVPDDLSDDSAALLEPLSVGIWSAAKAGLTAGGSVLIAGAGPIGLVTVQVARALGVTRIAVTDISPERLGVAADVGATETIDARDAAAPPGALVDAFIDCSGAPSAIEAGVAAVRPGGAVVLVGMGGDRLTLPFGAVQAKELTVTGTFRYANTWPTAIELVNAGLVDLDRLVSRHHPLEQTEEALLASRNPGHIKAIIIP
jgi:L-iditol 2-dehydrogenase